jgi:hypothetical protein
MHARTLKAVLFVAAAALMLPVAPSEAQAPPTTPTASAPPAVKKQQAPAKVTVRRRSFLDPGTETKTNQEHDRDYAFPPGDSTGAGRSTLFMQNYNVNYQLRNPFPNCFDVPRYCR